MLLQSQDGSIHLLPALPAAWPDGHVSGLCARGDFQVGMHWNSNQLVSAAIYSRQSGSCTVRYGEDSVSIRLEPGRTARLTEKSFVSN
jgi:alpha-L-fucosidase 2